jgi:hypothetical protein
MTIPLHRQLAAVRDEIALRRRVYAKWTAAGRMTESEAADRIDCMVAVLDTLTKLKAAEDERREPSLFPQPPT